MWIWVELSIESSDGDLRTRLWILGFFQAGSVLILHHGAYCVLALCCNADDSFCVRCVVQPEWNAANCTAVICTTCGMVYTRRRQCQVSFQEKMMTFAAVSVEAMCLIQLCCKEDMKFCGILRKVYCIWNYLLFGLWSSVGFWGRYIAFGIIYYLDFEVLWDSEEGILYLELSTIWTLKFCGILRKAYCIWNYLLFGLWSSVGFWGRHIAFGIIYYLNFEVLWDSEEGILHLELSTIWTLKFCGILRKAYCIWNYLLFGLWSSVGFWGRHIAFGIIYYLDFEVLWDSEEGILHLELSTIWTLKFCGILRKVYCIWNYLLFGLWSSVGF